MKAALFSAKGPAMATISTASDAASAGTGFLIHRNLLLTAHAILPSAAAAEVAEIRLQGGVAASLFPHRFFVSSSILDLTVVGVDAMDGDTNAQSPQPHYLKTCSKTNLVLGDAVYFLGYTEKKELTVGEGKVVIATDNLIKLSTEEVTWSPGSAGFDINGNLAFMICDPMKLATSPNTKSTTSSSSSSSQKKGLPMQFGIPIPIICDWLYQHWEGSLDEPNKPKLPIVRLISTGRKSDPSSASFTLRRVFKPPKAENIGTPSSSNAFSRPIDEPGPSYSVAATYEEDTLATDPNGNSHMQGIPTPEIYESPKLTAAPLGKKANPQVQLLNINFPPRIARAGAMVEPPRKMLSNSDENCVPGPKFLPESPQEENKPCSPGVDSEIASTGFMNDAQSEVQSSSPPRGVSVVQNGYSSEETIMYSAETVESRNYASPREGGKFEPIGRSQSCVSYRKWGIERNPGARRGFSEKQKNLQGRKIQSQGGLSQRSSDYFGPTVSSVMKNRNNSEEPGSQRRKNLEGPNRRPQQNAVHSSSPRWMF